MQKVTKKLPEIRAAFLLGYTDLLLECVCRGYIPLLSHGKSGILAALFFLKFRFVLDFTPHGIKSLGSPLVLILQFLFGFFVVGFGDHVFGQLHVLDGVIDIFLEFLHIVPAVIRFAFQADTLLSLISDRQWLSLVLRKGSVLCAFAGCRMTRV